MPVAEVNVLGGGGGAGLQHQQNNVSMLAFRRHFTASLGKTQQHQIKESKATPVMGNIKRPSCSFPCHTPRLTYSPPGCASVPNAGLWTQKLSLRWAAKTPSAVFKTASSSFFPPPHPPRNLSTHQWISPGRVQSENRNQSRYFQQGELNMRFNCTNGETREATQGERQPHNPQQEAPPSGWEDTGA